MPVAEFTPEHKNTSLYDYPRLTLDYGERARLILIEQKPHFEYIHTLRQPVLDEFGKVVMTTRKKFGKDVEEPEYDFIGRHICPGNIETITNKGVDVENCPVCAASKETSAVRAPERRFAMHVIRYVLKPGANDFTVATPLQVQCIGWAFGDKVFNQIVDFAEEFKDLRKHDLKLGPCENKQFQKYDINVAGEAVWLKDDDWKKLVVETYSEGKCEDLSVLIARRLTPELIQEDLEKVLTQHARAFKGGSQAASADTSEDLDAALNLGAVVGGDTPTETPAATDPAPETATEAEAPPAEGETVDFEDLLKTL